MDLMGELVALLVRMKTEFADLLGPFAPIVTSASQAIAAAIALLLLAFGKTLWAPPAALENFAARLTGILAALGVAAIYVWSKNGGNALHFLGVAMVMIIIGGTGAILYQQRRQKLCIACDDDPAIYVRGDELNPYAAQVLAGNLAGLPPQYVPKGPPPTDVDDYFCNSGKKSQFIWTKASVDKATNGLVRAYLAFAVPLIIGLAAIGTALTQPQIEIAGKELLLRGDVLFDFGAAELKPTAAADLDAAAAVILKRGATNVRIEGHTDWVGNEVSNVDLSRRRAEAVRIALTSRAGMDKVRFVTEGLGESQPIADNGTEAGRAKNRRVTILLDR